MELDLKSVLSVVRHALRNMSNSPSTQTAGNARQQLAKDIKDLRQNMNAPTQSLQQLIEMNKKKYPDAFKKQ